MSLVSITTPTSPRSSESLPAYSNHIFLSVLCRRKKELRAPLIKSRRRSWEVVWLVLDGTALKVYKPSNTEKQDFERKWKERTTLLPLRPKKEKDNKNRRSWFPQRAESPQDPVTPTTPAVIETEPITVPMARSPSIATAASRQSRRAKRARSDSMTKPRFSYSRPSQDSAAPFSPLPYQDTRALSPGSKHELISQFSLRHATCTRAITYFKRYFVLRFVMGDGKQFLVQLNSHDECVQWLQVVSVAAPLSLDLDERPMPDPAHYPRVYRRRTRSLSLPRTQPIPEADDVDPITTIVDPVTGKRRKRPRTAPGALENLPTMSQSPPSTSRMGTPPGTPGVPPSYVSRPASARASRDRVDVSTTTLDHLAAPPRPAMLRSLSSTNQAKQLGLV